MNLLIFDSSALINNQVDISGYQHAQIVNTLRCKEGDTIKVGAINGNTGLAKIVKIAKNFSTLAIQALDTEAPPPLNLSLIIALPRPQMIKRILQSVATLGVAKVYFVQSSRVEKSFWQSPALKPDEIKRQIILGLEQGVATHYPAIEMHQRFIPFVQDVLPNIRSKFQCFIAEPGPHESLASAKKGTQNLLAIGPEGGFIEKEIQAFSDLGFTPVNMGSRILKVETAVAVAAAYFL